MTMLQRSVFNKTLPCLSKFLWLGYANKFSNDSHNASSTAQKDNFESPSDREKLSRLLEESATYSDSKDKSWATTPYPHDAPIGDESTPPQLNPTETSVILFPGQGTISVGMIKKYLQFPNAKELFEIANEVLNYDLLKICLNGPQEKLNRTQFNQVATVVSSLAALEKLREERPRVFETCVATAGYSIGEITSLIFAGVLSFEDGIRLVSVRGTAMQFAAEKEKQGMLSVYCLPQAKLHQICTDAEKWAMDMGVKNPICKIAIYLYTQGKILAGSEEALQYIEKNSSNLGLSKLTRLPVSGAFHTPLMEPALKAVFKALNSVQIDEPRCQVYSNYKGLPYKNLQFVKKYLLKQIVSPVKWEQCIQMLYQRPPDTPFPRTFDVGSQGRMKLILKLINAKAADSCIAV